MKDKLALFIMIDACGWEILRGRRFGESFAPVRTRLRSVFGYSSACVPSILSGRRPCEHENWCYFVYDPERSPFRSLGPLRWLPKAVTSRRIFRRWLSKWVRQRGSFEGYFDLYNIPFEHIHLFDFTEKKSPLKPRGMNRGENIFDRLEQLKVPYFVSDPAASEEENLNALIERTRAQDIEFAFVYWAGLDGLLHSVGNDSPEIGPRLEQYECWIERALEAARRSYKDVRLYVFSDHGMANCDRHLDLRSRIDAHGLGFGRDYTVVYDSTMARFWFMNATARDRITDCLNSEPEGRIISEAELKELGAHFPDGKFGELIFLLREGTLLVPSHMGERPIRAMHGYHPDDPHSYAALLTTEKDFGEEIASIPDIYRLMDKEATELAESRASGRKKEKLAEIIP